MEVWVSITLELFGIQLHLTQTEKRVLRKPHCLMGEYQCWINTIQTRNGKQKRL